LHTTKFKALLGIFGIQDIEAIKLMRCRIFGKKLMGYGIFATDIPRYQVG